MRRTGRKRARKLLSIPAADAPNHLFPLFSLSDINKKHSTKLALKLQLDFEIRNVSDSPSDVWSANQKRDAKIDEANRKKTYSKITFDSSC